MITNYNELPIGKYLEILSLSEQEMEEDVRNTKILSVLSGMSEDELFNLPVTEYRRMMDQIEFILLEAEPAKMKKVYHLGGMDLVPVTQYRKMIAGQFLAFKQFDKAGEKYLAEMLSTMFVPKGHKYDDGYDVDAVVEAIRNELSFADALGLSAFFLDSLERWSRIILVYSRLKLAMRKGRTAKTARKILKECLRSMRSLDGCTRLMWSQRLCVAVGKSQSICQ